MKYVFQNPDADHVVGRQLRGIVRQILVDLSDVEAIILYGGFGRGEGSVRVSNGVIFPLKDYDILAVTRNLNLGEEINFNLLYDRLNIPKPSDGDFFWRDSFNITILRQSLRSFQNSYPSIMNYEIANASTLLYGQDVRRFLKYTVQDIPLSNGITFLFMKATGLIGHFDPSYLKKPIPEKYKINFLYECAKVYVEICTTLTLLRGLYVPSFIGRMKVFEENYKNSFQDLYDKLPYLAEKITFFTKFKLRPDFSTMKQDPIELWFMARDDLGIVLRYYIKEYLDIEAENWLKFSKRIYGELGYNYFRPLIKSFIKRIGLYPNTILISLINYIYQLRENIKYNKRVYGSSIKFPKITSLRYWRHPMIKVFSASLLILYSMSQEGNINRKFLLNAIDLLKRCYPIDKSINEKSVSTLTLFHMAKKHYIKSYNLLFK